MRREVRSEGREEVRGEGRGRRGEKGEVQEHVKEQSSVGIVETLQFDCFKVL